MTWFFIIALFGLIVCVVADVHRQQNEQDKARFDLECRLEQRIVKLERKCECIESSAFNSHHQWVTLGKELHDRLCALEEKVGRGE